MWKIELSKRDDALKTLMFNSTFTKLDQVVTYKLAPEKEIIDGVEIGFVSRKDTTKKDYYIEISDLVEKKITITYYNPGIGLSGLKEPMIILENDTYFFKVIFNTNALNNSDTYQLSIEFFIENKL